MKNLQSMRWNRLQTCWKHLYPLQGHLSGRSDSLQKIDIDHRISEMYATNKGGTKCYLNNSKRHSEIFTMSPATMGFSNRRPRSCSIWPPQWRWDACPAWNITCR